MGMLLPIKTLLRGLILPPAGLILLAFLGVILLKRRPRLARASLILGLGSLWLLSTPVVSDALERLAEHYPPLDLRSTAGAQAIDRLVDFTIDHFAAHPEFVALTLGENILKGRFIRASKLIPKLSSPLVEQISRVLARGAEQGVTPRGVDPVAFYLSIVALACHHLNNRYTLSATFGIDVGSERWKRDYKSHAKKIIMAFVSA